MIELKIIKKIIIIAIVIIILLIISLLILLNNSTKSEQDFEDVIYNDVEKVTNRTTFFNIDNCINKYFKYKFNNNTDAIKAINKENNIDAKEYNVVQKFYSQDMYSIDKVSNVTAFVYGVIRENGVEDEYYLIINLDYQNNTFELSKSSKEEYDKAKNNEIKDSYIQTMYIEKNQYNEIDKTVVSDFNILQRYFEDYKYKALYNQEKAFSLLDNEYKEKKFNNDINNYKTYIQRNISTFQDANIAKHSITKNGQYGEYIAVDNYNNYYKIIETAMNEYTIILDNYTLETEEFLNKYNKLSDEQKIASITDKVIKLINEKNYEELYNSLNDDFKNSKFKKQEDFEQYIKNNFFDNNITGTVQYNIQGNNIFMVTVIYKESLSIAAEERKTTLFVKLGEGTKFELSFNVD